MYPTKGNKIMSTIVALMFDDPYKAEEARAALHRMGGEGLLEIDETALIVKDPQGRMRLSQDLNVVSKDRRTGHILGMIVAAITGTMPFIVAGAAAGHILGRLTDNGTTNTFIKQIGKDLRPGTSALIMLGRSDEQRRQRVIEHLGPFQPKLVESDLPTDLENELQRSLAQHAA
jgi:uncharacterized membrane protein